MWVLTVDTLTPKLAAIRSLESPWTTRARMSRSRLVKSGRSLSSNASAVVDVRAEAAARRWLRRFMVVVSMTVLPETVARMASMNRSALLFLMRNPLAPASSMAIA